jgi:hypothetical protein
LSLTDLISCMPGGARVYGAASAAFHILG